MSSTPSTPTQIRQALATTARTLNPHQQAAVRLLIEHNRGRILEETTWLDAFVSLSGAGHAYIRWERLGLALDGDPVIAEEIRSAVDPYSDTERSIMRVAVDLGSDRWLMVRFDFTTRTQVADAVEDALLGSQDRRRGHQNTVVGTNTGSVIQAGNVYGGLSFP